MWDLDSLGARVKFVQQKVGGSSELERLTGATPSQQSKVIRNEVKSPGIHLMSEIAKAGGVSLDWLATGIGSADPVGDGSAYIEVPFVEGCDRSPVLFDQQLLKHVLRVSKGNARLFYQDSDSMEPTIKNNSVVMVDISKKTGDGIFLLRVADNYFLRRRDLNISNSAASYFRTDNAVTDEGKVEINRFVEKELDPEHPVDVELLGKVVWAGGPQ